MPSIRSLRLSRGMTVVELALEAGIPARTLGAIEYGHARLDAESAARLASSLGVAPEHLCAAHSYSTARLEALYGVVIQDAAHVLGVQRVRRG